MNSLRKSSGVAISRNFQKREFFKEEKKLEVEGVKKGEGASRREFFQTVIPASGKLLTNILRSVSTTISTVVDDTKQKKKL